MITALLVPAYSQTNHDVTQRNNAMTEEQVTQSAYWSMDYAQQQMKDSVTIPYGITNDDIYQQILAQKDRGDPNATYVYALLLLRYSIGDRTKTYNPNADAEGFQLMWELAQNDHPYACEYIGTIGLSSLKKFIAISEQEPVQDEALLQEQIRCLKIALQNGLKPYEYYADVLLFQLRKDEASDLSLTKSTELGNKELVQAAVQNYAQCAFDNGNRDCIGRMAEAYYHGIGVEKNLNAATAWARLIADRIHYDSGYPSVRFAKELAQEMSGNWEIYKAKETEALYEELKNKIPHFGF
jgi:hypothetical protein